MKIRKDFLLAVLILFILPIGGYFVLKQAEGDRMKISASLQPKDSIPDDFRINYLSSEGVLQNKRLVDLPYVLKVISTQEEVLDISQLEHILYIINDRSDFVFLLYEKPIKHSVKNRIAGFQPVGGGNLSPFGPILLVDAFNHILQIYDPSDVNVYSKLLEDISYAFPMVDYKIEKSPENAELQ